MAPLQNADFEGAEAAYSDGIWQMESHATEALYCRRFRAVLLANRAAARARRRRWVDALADCHQVRRASRAGRGSADFSSGLLMI